MAIEIYLLAAGLGTRMKSDQPKVIHRAAGKPLIYYTFMESQKLNPQAMRVVVGHEKDTVIEYLSDITDDSLKFNSQIQVSFVEQQKLTGTGEAVKAALEVTKEEAAKTKIHPDIIVLNGDLPLITFEEINSFYKKHQESKAVMSVLSFVTETPKGYGRIIRDKDNNFVEIIEEKECKENEKEIKEVNGGVYIFSFPFLTETINELTNANSKGEYYLTDLVKKAREKNLAVNAFKAEDADTLFGVNDRYQLAEASKILFRRKARELALNSGVTIIDPNSTYIETEVEIGKNSVIYPNTYIDGNTVIGSNVIIDINCRIINSEIGNGCIIKSSSYLDNCIVKDGATLGPFVHLRPKSEVGRFCKIGNFVELKNSKIGEHTNAAHLSYIGDAEVGSNVNIGCGFITCNFDGRIINGERKHKTIIEDNVFMGSDCQAVAPVKIGKGSFIASGSTITDEVPENSFAIARCKQTTKAGYAEKYKSKKEKKEE